MSDPWSDIAPSAVTSIVTTLATLAVTGTVAYFVRGRHERKRPIIVHRHRDTWAFENVTRRNLFRVGFSITRGGGGLGSADVGTVEPDSWYGLDFANPGDSIRIWWSHDGPRRHALRRWITRRPIVPMWQGEVVLRSDVDRYEMVRRRWPGPRR